MHFCLKRSSSHREINLIRCHVFKELIWQLSPDWRRKPTQTDHSGSHLGSNSNETQSSADKSSRIVKANKFDVKENRALDGRGAEENGSNLVSWWAATSAHLTAISIGRSGGFRQGPSAGACISLKGEYARNLSLSARIRSVFLHPVFYWAS